MQLGQLTRRRARPVSGALLSAGAAVLTLVLVTVPARGETLSDALALAYRGNPELLAQRAQLRAIDEQVPQALSGWRPTVIGEGAIGKARGTANTDTTSFGNSSETRTPRSLRLTIEQPIFRGFRTVSATRAAEATVRSERAQLINVEQDVLFRVISAYMDVVRDSAIVRLNENNVEVLGRQLQATRDRFEVGEVTRTDVAQAEARLSSAEAALVGARGDLETSRAAYNNIVGQYPVQLEPDVAVPDVPGTLPAARKITEENSPTILFALYAEEAQRHQIDVVGGELLPSISLNGELSRGLDTVRRGSASTDAQILAQVRVPLYQSGAVTSRLREAKERTSQRRMQLADARRDAHQATTAAWESLTAARAQIRSFEAAVRANEIALEGVEQEAQAGLRTVLDILDAEQELLDSRVNLVGARRDTVVAAYQLWAALGWLTAENLSLPVELYDPSEHYDDVRDLPWGLGGPVADPVE